MVSSRLFVLSILSNLYQIEDRRVKVSPTEGAFLSKRRTRVAAEVTADPSDEIEKTLPPEESKENSFFGRIQKALVEKKRAFESVSSKIINSFHFIITTSVSIIFFE